MLGTINNLKKQFNQVSINFPKLSHNFSQKMFLVLQAIGKVFRNVGLHKTLFQNKCM